MYNSLQIGDFAAAEPALRTYLDSIADYERIYHSEQAGMENRSRPPLATLL
jgi:hypothetical protein